MTTLNPFDNQKAYGRMLVGPNALPGIVLEIDGADRDYDWDVQKPVATGGAAANFKGQKIADGIRVKCGLVTAGDFLDLAKVRAALRPAKGQKPSAFDVTNAILNNQGIKSVTVKKIGQEKWEGEGGKGLWTVELVFLEYDPPKATAVGAVAGSKSAGAAGAAPGSPGYVEPVQSAADKKIDALLATAKAA
jgi:hypothetical protein